MNTRLWTPARAGASMLFLASMMACSTLPPQRPAEVEREIIATYSFYGGSGDRAVIRVPGSGDGLTIVSLETEPADLREAFDGEGRLFYPTTDSVQLRCRYRAIQIEGDGGELQPIPEPEEVFPGSSSIEVIEG